MLKTWSVNSSIFTDHLDEVRNKNELKHIVLLIKNTVPIAAVVSFAYPQSLTDKYQKCITTINSLVQLMVVNELHISELRLPPSRLSYFLNWQKLPL